MALYGSSYAILIQKTHILYGLYNLLTLFHIFSSIHLISYFTNCLLTRALFQKFLFQENELDYNN